MPPETNRDADCRICDVTHGDSDVAHGILYQDDERPTYEAQVSALKHGPLVHQHDLDLGADAEGRGRRERQEPAISRHCADRVDPN